MEVSIKEVLRYLRMKEASPELEAEIREVIAQLERQVTPRAVSRTAACEVREDEVRYGGSLVKSRSLARHLKGCREVILFAATLGPAPDRLVRRFQVDNTVRMVIVQAAATAMIESFCNEEQRRLAEIYREKGLYLKPRFSPGYGDCALACQRELFRCLDISRQIGVSLTDGCMMVPTKSVTAWIGVTGEESCHVGKCRRCPHVNCEFREEEA